MEQVRTGLADLHIRMQCEPTLADLYRTAYNKFTDDAALLLVLLRIFAQPPFDCS